LPASEQQVKVIGHQAIRVNLNSIPLTRLATLSRNSVQSALVEKSSRPLAARFIT
jgi:hypothetical protein